MKKFKELYEDWSPFIQITGYLVLAAVIVFKSGTIWDRIDAYDGRITAVETVTGTDSKGLAVINQKLDDLNHNVAQLTNYLLNRKVAENDRGQP